LLNIGCTQKWAVSQVLSSEQPAAQLGELGRHPKPFGQVWVTQAPVESQGPTQWVTGFSGQVCRQHEPPEQTFDWHAWFPVLVEVSPQPPPASTLVAHPPSRQKPEGAQVVPARLQAM
jgi:hypothetical protein